MALEFIRETVETFYRSDRFFNSGSAEETCAAAEAVMREIGMVDVKTLHFTADGKTSHGGWVMPLAWFPKTAVLSEVSPDGSECEVCSYEKCPCSLMMYSQSADVTAEVTADIAGDVAGRLVLISDHFVTIPESEALLKRGALGIISSFLDGTYHGKAGYEYLDDVCQWCNYQLPFHAGGEAGFGFSITPRQGRAFQMRLARGEKVVLHCKVDADLRPGTLPLVTGVLPGESREEILLAAHLFEQGANDNCSGGAVALAVARELAGKPRRRSIRIMLTNEIKSLQAYVNTAPDLPEMVAGINLDMVGKSLDKCAVLGPSTPGYGNFAVPFLAKLLQKRGCSLRINPTAGMDTLFCDPCLDVPMSFMEFMADPDYHRSSDTPEKLMPEIVKLSYETALEFTAFLVNAGTREAIELAETVVEMEPFLPHLPGEAPRFAREEMTRRIMSVLRLTAENERAEVQQQLSELSRMCQKVYPEKGEVFPRAAAVSGEVVRDDIFPVKNFQGLFSFEKYWLTGNVPEKIASEAGGWHAGAWIEIFFILADGSRSTRTIYTLLTECGYEVSAQKFMDMVAFLLEEGYLLNNSLAKLS